MVKPSTSLWTFELFTWLGWKLKRDSCLPQLIQLPFCLVSPGDAQCFFVYGLQHFFDCVTILQAPFFLATCGSLFASITPES